jgi:glycerol-3-phosphate dehydrogenase (NAD(P)+)
VKISILGAGAWGTALALSFARGHSVRLWGRDADQMADIARRSENVRYLPGIAIPKSLALSIDLHAALDGAELLLAAVPTNALRDTLQLVAQEGAGKPFIWACKGFEKDRGQLPHQIVASTLNEATASGALSGPSFAQEVAEGKPAALTLASSDAGFAQELARKLNSNRLRVYSSNDLAGVELGGAVKNVIAIAAGICDGLGLGNNARAALITRGLAETTRLGLRMGGQLETFMGLTGLGDLVLTTTGDLSRNRRVGLALARGEPIATILKTLGHVAEGVSTAPEVARIAARLGVEMPITEAVCAVIDGKLAAAAAVDALMRRDPKSESPSDTAD